MARKFAHRTPADVGGTEENGLAPVGITGSDAVR
jgi:hypothetical protein